VARVQVNDVPFGTGRVDVAAVLAELKRQGFQGHIGLEYENFESPTFAEDLRQMVRFVCDQGK
jgi:sugar phosphate isomerase/epimerase